MGETKILQMPWGFGKKNDNYECLWTSDAVFKPVFTGIAFSLATAPLTGKHFCVSSSSYTHKAPPVFSKNGSSRHARYCCMRMSSDINASPTLVIIFPEETEH
jgi:hypothetical protein